MIIESCFNFYFTLVKPSSFFYVRRRPIFEKFALVQTVFDWHFTLKKKKKSKCLFKALNVFDVFCVRAAAMKSERHTPAPPRPRISFWRFAYKLNPKILCNDDFSLWIFYMTTERKSDNRFEKCFTKTTSTGASSLYNCSFNKVQIHAIPSCTRSTVVKHKRVKFAAFVCSFFLNWNSNIFLF